MPCPSEDGLEMLFPSASQDPVQGERAGRAAHHPDSGLNSSGSPAQSCGEGVPFLLTLTISPSSWTWNRLFPPAHTEGRN